MRATLLAAVVFLVALAVPRAGVDALAHAPDQTQTPETPRSFEVASVKPNKSGTNFIRMNLAPGGRFIAENVPARELIRFAYQVQPFQIEGGPGWLGSDRFDITAKAEGDIPPTPPNTAGPIQMMVRSLLAERFQLVVRNQTKEMAIYALVLNRSDGRLGPKLTPSSVDCVALFASRRGGPPPAPPAPGERPPCGMRVGPGNLMAGSTPISQLAQMLSQMMGRVVLDTTGLAGSYDFDLVWTPDQIPQAGPGGPPPGAPPLPPIDPNGPSLSTAVQEQLGLKLDSQRGPVPMLVIERIEQPSPD